MGSVVELGGRRVGEGYPCYIIAEIGINHNGDIGIAKKLISSSKLAGCDSVKFQKRTPEVCTPKNQQNVMRETPWGLITYLEYRHKVEFGHAEYNEIRDHSNSEDIDWFASVWDCGSVDFLSPYELPCIKIPSAGLTDHKLLEHVCATKRPIMISTGMSTMRQIREAVDILGTDNLLICHCTSTYPCPPNEINLRMIQTLKEEFDCPIGYSGHETGLQTTIAAVAMGASFIERHVTLDRAMWGSDHAASVEPWGVMRLVRDIRIVESAVGDGQKRVYESESQVMAKLRVVS